MINNTVAQILIDMHKYTCTCIRRTHSLVQAVLEKIHLDLCSVLPVHLQGENTVAWNLSPA